MNKPVRTMRSTVINHALFYDAIDVNEALASKSAEISELKAEVERLRAQLTNDADAVKNLLKFQKKLNEENGKYWLADINNALSTAPEGVK